MKIPGEHEGPPLGPDVSPILELHRAPDGYVAFGRKPLVPKIGRNGQPIGYENLFSIKVAELRGMFPQVASWLTRDAYFTVNSMYRAAPYTHKGTGLHGAYRKEEHLRYLTACYADLDVGRPESAREEQRLTWRDAAAVAGKLMDDGILPQASIFARSGRGVYLFWILRDEADPGMPVRAWPEKLTLYKQINKALHARLTDLAVDRGAFDAARVLRAPNTIHSKTERPATYQIQYDQHFQKYTYTLRELAAFLGIEIAKPSLPKPIVDIVFLPDRPPKSGKKQPGRRKGFNALNAMRAVDLVSLEQYRGGFTRGERTQNLRLYTHWLKLSGVSLPEALTAVSKMAGNCKPPYPSDPNDTPLHKLVSDIYSGKDLPRKHLDTTLCSMLRVTPELARELELQTIIPPEVRKEREAPPGGQRGLDKAARIEAIQAEIGRRGGITCREMTNILKAKGFKTNRTTVNKDMTELGYVIHGRGRPKTTKR